MRNNLYFREYSRLRHKKLEELGLCTRCGKNVQEDGYKLCEKCRKYVRDRKRKIRKFQRENNLCIDCGKHKTVSGRKRCFACLIKQRKYINDKRQLERKQAQVPI